MAPDQFRHQGGFSLVELLVVIILTGIIATAITSVILSTTRTQSFTQEVRTVMDDGRISIERMRTELRAARRVLPEGSTEGSVRFWLDRNQDGAMDDDEIICYAVAEIGDTDTYELLRWTGATGDLSDCNVDPDSGLVEDRPDGAQSVARTLVTHEEIFTFDPEPDPDPQAPRTRLVTIELLLDVRTNAGPSEIRVETTVRLRNVD